MHIKTQLWTCWYHWRSERYKIGEERGASFPPGDLGEWHPIQSGDKVQKRTSLNYLGLFSSLDFTSLKEESIIMIVAVVSEIGHFIFLYTHPPFKQRCMLFGQTCACIMGIFLQQIWRWSPEHYPKDEFTDGSYNGELSQIGSSREAVVFSVIGTFGSLVIYSVWSFKNPFTSWAIACSL